MAFTEGTLAFAPSTVPGITYEPVPERLEARLVKKTTVEPKWDAKT